MDGKVNHMADAAQHGDKALAFGARRLSPNRSADRVQEDREGEHECGLVSDLEVDYGCHMKKLIAVIGAVVLLPSCFGSFSADRSTLPARASFDMGCPQEMLQFSDLGNDSVGVAGCGRKAVYVSACDGQPGQMTTSCKWVQN